MRRESFVLVCGMLLFGVGGVACAKRAIAMSPGQATAVLLAPSEPAAGGGYDMAAVGAISPEERAAAIEKLVADLDAHYVFPDLAKKVGAALHARAKRGEYDKLVTGRALAKALSTSANETLKDAHFRVRYQEEKIPETEMKGAPTAAEVARWDAVGQKLNGGFERVERLKGNIGYVDVKSLAFVRRGADAAAAAMSFLADTDALIIDLRENHGGEPDMVNALASYFFSTPVHVNDIFDRDHDETRQYWTSASVPGPRYTDKDVYVLVSKATGSAAEELAYDLKTQKRATIVGEPTWGGANPGDLFRLSDHLSAFIPNGRAINPITKSNWEGAGVAPDLVVPPSDARRVAQVKAIEAGITKATDPEWKSMLQERLHDLNETKSEQAPEKR